MAKRRVLSRLLWVSGVLTALGGGCGGGDKSPPCSAGDDRDCTCVDGSVGHQECDGDGPLWFPCSCDGTDTGGRSGTGGGGGLCTNSCPLRSDGSCDDGGPGADQDYCALGTDCDDCGPRFAQSGGGSGGSGVGGSGTGGRGTGGGGTGGSGSGGEGTGGGGTGGADTSGGSAGTTGSAGAAGILAGGGGIAGSAGLVGGGATAGATGAPGGAAGTSGTAGSAGEISMAGSGGIQAGGSAGRAAGGASTAGSPGEGGAGGGAPAPGGSFDFESDLEGWAITEDTAGLCPASTCATHAAGAGYDAMGSVELVVPFSGASQAVSFGYDLPEPQDLSGREYSVWIYADSGALDNPANRQPSIEMYALSGTGAARAGEPSVFPVSGQWFELTLAFDSHQGVDGFDAGDVRQIGITVATPAAGANGTLTIHLDAVVF
jgi:hypothetical protein